jgi:hypothetical protein
MEPTWKSEDLLVTSSRVDPSPEDSKDPKEIYPPSLLVTDEDIKTAATLARKPKPREANYLCKKCSTSYWQNARLAAYRTYGAAGLGGGEDDRTLLYDLGFREGVRGQPSRGQGVKLPALDSSLVREAKFTQCLAPDADFPRHLPVTFARLKALEKEKGALDVVAVPVELTVAMGYRIRRNLDLNPNRSVLIGLATEYASYTATPEEYEAQEYVGASTMWGPEEGLVLGCALEQAEATLPAGPRKKDILVTVKDLDPGPSGLGGSTCALPATLRLDRASG